MLASFAAIILIVMLEEKYDVLEMILLSSLLKIREKKSLTL